MENNLVTLILAVVGVLGGAGAWQFYAKRIELKYQANKEDNREQNLFRDQILQELERVKTELANANSQVLSLTAEVSTLRERVRNLEIENDRLKSR